MTEDFISKLRKLISTAKYEEALHLCDMELSLLDLNNCDKEWLARIYFFKGVALFSLGNKEDALNFYNLAIENNNNYHQAYYNRGYLYHCSNDLEKAINDYSKSIMLDPSYTNAYYNRGVANFTLGNYQEAIFDYEKVIELEPNNFGIYNTRGGVYATLNDYEKAILDYNKAIEMNPHYFLAYYNRAKAKINLTDYEGSILDLYRLLELDPENFDEYCKDITELLLDKEQYDIVIDFATKEYISPYDIDELFEQGKIREENYNKLLENPEYKKYKEKYEKERLEDLEELQKAIRNPFLLAKEFILYTAIYPIIRFINRFKKK